ncbi:MAG TPA: 50S ribosomal protein L3 [Crenotrichaceae bacterium]|nr:50S ribosomal protein L3 [Crenotrichaceae bacterium]
MAIGLVGRKQGMTRVFTDDGVSVPVTVVEIVPNRITQIKTQEKDGYSALQVTTGEKKVSRVSKPLIGHYAVSGVVAGRGLWEFRINADEIDKYKVGDSISLDILEEGQALSVTGTSKGKGFAGGVKRHNFKMQDATHGNSISHRAPGSIGQCQTPGRVFKGKKMAGHMGSRKTTVKSVSLIKLYKERNIILLKGAVPGAIGGDVIVKSMTLVTG